MTAQTKPTLPPTETAQPWPEQGHWTYEDYVRLPDDGRRNRTIESVGRAGIYGRYRFPPTMR